jgi:peptidoglycan/LPS O-acetylase OafA/YrhL
MNLRQRQHGRQQISALTEIRGIAACWVVSLHFYETLSYVYQLPERSSIPIVRSGYLGVDLFFILSGFVLTLTYGDQLSTFSKQALIKFSLGRIFRILPLHLIVLSFLLVLVTLAPGQFWGPGPFTFKAFVASIFLIQGWVGMAQAWNNPAWSLSAEWLAYVCFVFLAPIYYQIQSRRLTLILAFASILPLLAIMIAIGSPVLNHSERLGLVRCICEFSVGMFLCKLWKTNPISERTSQTIFYAGLVCLAAAIATPMLDVVAIVAFSAIIFSCATQCRPVQIIFGGSITKFLGDISFSIYLVHVVLLNLCLAIARMYFLPEYQFIAVILGLAGVIPLAWLTWCFIEVPGQTFGRRLVSRIKAQELDLAHLSS